MRLFIIRLANMNQTGRSSYWWFWSLISCTALSALQR